MRRGAGVEQAWFAEALLLLGSLKLGETCVGEVMNVCLSCEVACLLGLSLSPSYLPFLFTFPSFHTDESTWLHFIFTSYPFKFSPWRLLVNCFS